MRVLLADDHNLVRAGIRGLVESLPETSVVAETGDGREALELIGRHRPDVALLDITMPGLNGLEVAERVGKLSPKTRIVVLSMHADEMYVAHALRVGVVGYLLKDAAAAELGLALQAVARGDSYLSPAISRQVVDGFLRGSGGEPDPLAGLTARQREISRLLDVSVKTVETHRAQLMKRLDIHDVPGLVRFAIRAGLVSSDS